MWHHVAELVDEWGADLVGERGLSSVGAVVGATHPRAVARGAQADAAARSCCCPASARRARRRRSRRAFTSGPASALVNASRSVIYAFRDAGRDYREAAGAEAARLKREIWAASGW